MESNIGLFFGRFHPLIVHLPIGILLFAALLELLATVRKNDALQVAIKVALLTGAFCASLAALAGYFLSTAGGYDQSLLFWHQWLGISIGGLALLAWWLKQNQRFNRIIYKARASQWVVVVVLLVIGITGHLGGNLTHGSTYLTEYMPAPVKSIFGTNVSLAPKSVLPANVDSVLVFQHLVQPMLNAKCVSCHNPDKARGDLLLDSQAGILKGGKSGAAITPGDWEKSELIRRITLPSTSSKFMPANQLPSFSNTEVAILKWWVANGADFKKTSASLGTDAKTKFLLAVYLGLDPEPKTETVLPKVTAANPVALKGLREAGIMAKIVSDGSNLLDVSFITARNVSTPQRQQQLQKLLKVKEQVYWLNISGCGLSSEDMKLLGQLSNMAKLNVQENNISDAGMGYLQGLKKIEYLNIYQNPLTDKSIPAIQQLPALKKINLWQTQLSKKGIAGLTAGKQGLEVIF